MNLGALNQNLQREILLKLPPVDFINYCVTSKENYKSVCNNDFWRLKIKKDYPQKYLSFEKKGLTFKNPKQTYIKLFQEETQMIENRFGNLKSLIKLIGDTYKEIKTSSLFFPYIIEGKNKDKFEILTKEILIKKIREAKDKYLNIYLEDDKKLNDLARKFYDEYLEDIRINIVRME